MSTESQFRAITRESLGTQIVAARVVYFEETASTNTCALEQGRDGDVFVADRQTAGRGRQGRTWHSAPGLGLWFTVALKGEAEGLVFAAALAVRAALAGRCAPTIKWPNDVLVNAKKICGILVEQRNDAIAVGIGINVNHLRSDFPNELEHSAGSLFTETGEEWDRVALLRDVLTHLDRRVILLRNGQLESVRNEWARACDIVGKRIESEGHTGVVAAIDEAGAIVLDTANGSRRVISGHITVLDDTSPATHDSGD